MSCLHKNQNLVQILMYQSHIISFVVKQNSVFVDFLRICNAFKFAVHLITWKNTEAIYCQNKCD